jgi:hypothetical protein
MLECIFVLPFLFSYACAYLNRWNLVCTASFKHKIRRSLMSFNYIDLKPKYPPLNFAAATAVMLAALEASLEGGGGGGRWGTQFGN